MWNKYGITACIYCGEPASDRHHYKESIANSGRKRRYANKEETLPTCRECNLLLGSLNPSYTESCYFLYDKVSTRHKNVLQMPNWDKAELSHIAGHLRRTTRSKLSKKKITMERLKHLLDNAQSPMTYKEIRDIVRFGDQ